MMVTSVTPGDDSEEEAESRIVGPFSHISTRKGNELLKSALGTPDPSEEHLLPL